MLQIFGRVTAPPSGYFLVTGGGIVAFISVIVKLLIVIAGLYMLFNIIFAGYQFISAGGDQKSVEAAWGKIWQSLVGLLIVAGSVMLAALFGWILFGDTSAILSPKIYTP